MKKSISVLLLLCMLIGMFGGVSAFAVEGEELAEAAVEEIAEETAEVTAEAAAEETAEEPTEAPAEEPVEEEPAASEEIVETAEASGEMTEEVVDPAEDGGAPEFYAVRTMLSPSTPTDTDYSLSFYYDTNKPTETDAIKVYTEFPTNPTSAYDWLYNMRNAEVSIVNRITSVTIDESVKNYKGLTSTAYMFAYMNKVQDCSGFEYLDVSNVTNMSGMFAQFGSSNTTFNFVPNVKDWDTSKVTNMSAMFSLYGRGSAINAVPDVSNWNTSAVTNMKAMFNNYGYNSSALSVVPNVSKWDTSKVTTMASMFSGYAGNKSTVINAVPDVSNWDTSEVTTMASMFNDYGKTSTALTVVPDVKNWNTGKVTDMSSMFSGYGKESVNITAVPNVTKWNTSAVTDISYMFRNYAASSTATLDSLDLSAWNIDALTTATNLFYRYAAQNTSNPIVYATDWSTAKSSGVTAMGMFTYSKLKGNTTGAWESANTSDTGCFTKQLAPCYVTEGGKNTYYASLEDAINAAKTAGNTVTLVDDVTTPIRLLDGDVVLDLNGHSINCESDTGDAYAITLSGSANLTIQDSSADNSGAVNAKSSLGAAQAVVMNGTGTLKVEGGNLNAETTGDYNAVAIQLNDNCKVEISGNAVVSAKAENASASGIYDATGSEISVSGGKVSAYIGLLGGWACGIESYSNSTINISGGTVEASGEEEGNMCYGLVCQFKEEGSVTITGGTITGCVGVDVYGNGDLTISGTPNIHGTGLLYGGPSDIGFGGNTFDFSGYDGESLGNVNIYGGGEIVGSLSKFGEDSVICGGTFDEDPSRIFTLPEECVVTLNPDTGKYEVTVIEPVILEGAKQTIDLNKAGVTLTVRCNAPYNCYLGTQVDGKYVDEKYCTVSEGSTIVTLSNAFLKTLKAGTHTLSIETTIGDVETTFTIQSVNEDKPPKSPATGDDSGLGLWIVLTGMSVLALGAVLTLKRKEN